MRLMIDALTDVGRARDHNEDAVLADPGHRFVVVADGMGGHNAGEVASELVQRSVGGILRCVLQPPENPGALAPPPQGGWLKYAIERAHATILGEAQRDAARKGMGSTVVALVHSGAEVEIAHVGDSRCYRFRNGALQQLTKDHSAQGEIDDLAGEDDMMRDFLGTTNKVPTNVITRALGIGDSVDVDVRRERMVAGDVYLLCSDGLSGMVKDRAMEGILRQAMPDLRGACTALIQAANAGGGEDNITVALAAVIA